MGTQIKVTINTGQRLDAAQLQWLKTKISQMMHDDFQSIQHDVALTFDDTPDFEKKKITGTSRLDLQ